MAHGTWFTSEEKSAIDALESIGVSVRGIAANTIDRKLQSATISRGKNAVLSQKNLATPGNFPRQLFVLCKTLPKAAKKPLEWF